MWTPNWTRSGPWARGCWKQEVGLAAIHSDPRWIMRRRHLAKKKEEKIARGLDEHPLDLGELPSLIPNPVFISMPKSSADTINIFHYHGATVVGHFLC